MKGSIWKFQVEISDEFALKMPLHAHILTVQTQRDIPCIWALVDLEDEIGERRFKVFGTGHPANDADQFIYIGTFQLASGGLVFHLFED